MQTLIDALRDIAKHTEKGITFVRSDGREQTLSYCQVWDEARRRAHFLERAGIPQRRPRRPDAARAG